MDVNHWLQQQKQQQNLAQQSIQQRQQQNLVHHSIQQRQPQNQVHPSIQQRNLVQQSIQQRQQQLQNVVHQSLQQQNLVQQSIQQPQQQQQLQNVVHQSIQQQQNLVQHTIQQQQPNLVQQSIQQQQQQNLVQQSETFKNSYKTDGSIDVADLPQFHIAGSEPRKKRLQEQDFVEKNSQVMPIDFFPTQPISTGLGLSLDNGRLASSCDSSYFGRLVNGVESHLSQYKDDLGQFITDQAEQLKREILKKMERNKMCAISYVEVIIERLRAQEDEVVKITKRNKNLVQQIEQLSMESQMWQQRSNYHENKSKELNLTLEQLVNAQTGDRKEGIGDNGVDDTGSCVNGQTRTTKPFMCIVCEAKGACMILMPCKHLCVCKDCESGLKVCPICQTQKISYIEIV